MIAATFAISAALLAQAEPISAAERGRMLLEAKDARPELLYNAGVGLYRDGDLELARELFTEAASRAKAGIAARSMYNRGTTSYAAAAKELAAGAQPGSQAPMEALERALKELKDAVRADPSSADARANAELAHRVLKRLKDQQQQDQQQDGEQDDQQQQQQQNDQQDGDRRENQGEKQDEKKDQNQDGKQDEQQGQDGDPRQEQQPPDAEQRQDEQSEPKEPKEPRTAQKPMTQQDVERLLQKIRDKERARLIEKLARERTRTQPAAKDW